MRSAGRKAIYQATTEILESRVFLSTVPSDYTGSTGTLPALFVKNQGQWADFIKYAYQNGAGSILMTDKGPIFDLLKPGQNGAATTAQDYWVRFDGANTVSPTGVGKSSVKFNYYMGEDGAHLGVKGYQAVEYQGLYDGIDLYTMGKRNALKYEFHVAPGADYTKVKISYEGIEGLSIDSQGRLHINAKLGSFVDDAPFVYQKIDGKIVEIKSSFKLLDNHTYTFDLAGDYDHSKELVLDPEVFLATYLGGSAADTAVAVAADQRRESASTEFLYVTGTTQSGLTQAFAFPGFDAFYDQKNQLPPPFTGAAGIRGTDSYLAKFTTQGRLIWVTFIGGRNNENVQDIALDSTGAPYIVGDTNSSDFLTTLGAFKTLYGNNGTNGGTDGFLMKFSRGGLVQYASRIAPNAATTAGGSNDNLRSIDIDANDFVYVAGASNGDGWAVGLDPLQTDGATRSGMNQPDGIVAKMDLTKFGIQQMVWARYVGGGDTDNLQGISVATDGVVNVVGNTTSSDLLVTIDAPQLTRANNQDDLMIARISQTGATLFLSYYGGTGDDDATGVDADPVSGDIVITGMTTSSDFPVVNPIDATNFDGSIRQGAQDAFVLRFSAALFGLQGLVIATPTFATYFGGSGGGDVGNDVIWDNLGRYTVVGATNSSTTTATDKPYPISHFDSRTSIGLNALVRGTDAFIARFDSTNTLIDSVSTSAQYSALIGGTGTDQANGAALTSGGQLVVVGQTSSTDLLVLSNGSDFPLNLLPALQDRFQIEKLGQGSGSANDAFIFIIQTDKGQGIPLPPTNYRATALSTTEIRLNWIDNSTNETGFLIYRRTDADFLFNSSDTPLTSVGRNVTSFIDTGLTPGTHYFYYVAAANGNGIAAVTDRKYADATTFTPALATPTSLVATGVSPTEIDLSWNDLADNEDHYLIFRREGNGGEQQVATIEANSESFTDTGLNPDTQYSYRVQAVNSLRVSAFSNPATAATKAADFLRTPTGVQSHVTHDGVVVTWDDNSNNETGYSIERANVVGGIFAPIGTVGANTEAFLDDTADPDKVYFYRVRAFNATQFSQYSDDSTSDLDKALARPLLLEARAASSNMIVLTWNDKALTETNYIIERGVNGPDFDVIATIGPNTKSYTDRGLSPKTKYLYRIRATDGTHFSKYSNTATEVSLPLNVTSPTAPTGLKATATGKTSVHLSWNDNSSNESAFSIERSASIDGPFVTVGTTDRDVHTFDDDGLDSGKTYFYRVRARVGATRSGVAGPVNVRTLTTPTISITAVDDTGTEAGNPLVFKITRKGSLAGDLVIKYSLTGTATNGADYTKLTGTATIKDGKASVNVTVLPKNDSSHESDETVVFTLASNSTYKISSGAKTDTGTIDDDDPAPSSVKKKKKVTTTAFSTTLLKD